MKRAVLLLDSQPPHIGEFLQVLTALKKYDFLYICFYTDPLVMSFDQLYVIWNALLQPYKTKIRLANCKLNLSEVQTEDLPELFNGCTYIMSDKFAFTHFIALGLEPELLLEAIGYNSLFLREAYRKTRALNWLEGRFPSQIKR